MLQIKQRENDVALKYYQRAVKSLDELSWEEKQFSLVRGVLAGNVFDWGAKAVSEYVESTAFNALSSLVEWCLPNDRLRVPTVCTVPFYICTQ